MKKIIVLLLPLILTSCDYIGGGKVMNLIDLTPKLKSELSDPPKLISQRDNIEFSESSDVKSYPINKSQIISNIAIAKGIAYSLDQNGNLEAFSLKNKKSLWCTVIKDSSVVSYNKGAVLYSDGKLYITNGTREMLVVDAEQGTEIMRKTFPDLIITKPVMLSESFLVVQTVSNQLIGFDLEKSGFTWINEGGIETLTSRNHIDPVNIDGNIFASYTSGEVLYVDSKTGENKWSYNLNDRDYLFDNSSFEPTVIITKPIISKDHVYFATSNSQILKMNLQKGQVVWKKNISDIHSVATSGDNLIITTNARQVAILSNKDGKIKWVADLITDREKAKRRPAVVSFQTPFVVSDEYGIQSLNIIASNGELYQFYVNAEDVLASEAVVMSIPRQVENYWISCCNSKIHFFSKKSVSF